ncbi:ubiquitin-binding protein cue5 [Pseudocyphellaria aurata]|nr:ubiquitin-binding protein cue5 [Pseudocyphellaria aurata]
MLQKLRGRPESPTTARELDFDDEPQDTVASPPKQPSTSRTEQAVFSEDVPPPKPPRPLSPNQQSENTLREAFPSIDASVVKAVLRASGGSVEPAFNALLGMSDPDSQVEPTPPPQPPRKAQPQVGPTSTAQSQLLADEQYARQLAEHYSGTAPYSEVPRTGQRIRQTHEYPRQRKELGLKPNELYDDREHSFIDDDLPVIRENIKKGFLETQSKVNSWVATLRKKIDGEDDEDNQARPAQATSSYDTRPSPQVYGRRKSGELERRSVDRDRYDADPQVLGDDFAGLQLRDQDDPPRRSSRPLANPDLFKPTPPRPQTGSGRRVSFQEGPPEEIDTLYRASPDSTKRPTSGGGKSSKWQPLSAVDPSPVADHDPFSLVDSDDEESKRKDPNADDSNRLKQATAEAMTDEISIARKKDLELDNRSGNLGTRDKEAESLRTGKP